MVSEVIVTAPERPVDKASQKAVLEQRYEALLRENGAALKRLAASHTRTAGDRDDLFQEIAMAIWQALPAFRGESSERTFLFRIAHNRAIAFLSRKRVLTSPVEQSSEPLDLGPGPETQAAQRQQSERLFGAIRRLPLPYRQAVTLALEGLEYAEIADVLGIGESNVGVRLSRARKLLRELLESAL